jgi:hypothetical protein
MSEAPQAEPMRHEQRVALLRWGFPFVILMTTLAGQVLLPHILQLHLSDGQYVSYVAVAALVAYLPLADGGMVVAIQREMSFLHGAGNKGGFAGELHRARRIFRFVGIACCVIGVLGIWSTMNAAEQAWTDASQLRFRLSVVALLAVTAFHVSVGGLHTIVQLSTGRLIAGQATGVISIFGPLVVLIATLLITRDLSTGLIANAIAIAAVALWRKADMERILREEIAGVTPARPHASIRRLLASGLPIKAAEVLPSSAFPHALSLANPALVLSAVPARTYANACRLIPQQFASLLFSHLTRRMAGAAVDKRRGIREHAISATCLATAHLIAIGVLGLLAVPVFSVWLPARENDITLYLAGLFVEQALMSAAIPSTLLFAAWGRLGLLGMVQLISVFVGLAVFLILVPIIPKAAFGIGFAASAIPVFVLGAVSELRSEFKTASGVARYATAIVAAAACVGYARWPTTMSCVVLLCAAVHVPAAVAGLKALFDELRARDHERATRRS